MLYSLGDFQLALSAFDFLLECDPEAIYSRVELRRFRCFETTMIVAYSRPFTTSKDKMPHLSMKMIGVELTAEQQALHERLLTKRNKAVAHSDKEHMRMAVKSFPIEMLDREPLHLFDAVFDEGLDFLGSDLLKVGDLINTLIHSTHETLVRRSQASPDRLDVRLNADGQNPSK